MVFNKIELGIILMEKMIESRKYIPIPSIKPIEICKSISHFFSNKHQIPIPKSTNEVSKRKNNEKATSIGINHCLFVPYDITSIIPTTNKE